MSLCSLLLSSAVLLVCLCLLRLSSLHSTSPQPTLFPTLPQDWFNYFTFGRLTSYNSSLTTGTTYSFCSSLDDTAHIPLVQLGGTAVFSQTAQLTTAATVRQPYTLQMALNWKGQSSGRLTVDDGLAIGNIAAGEYNAFHATAALNIHSANNVTGAIRFVVQQLAEQYDVSQLFVQRVVVMGADVAEGAVLPMPVLTVAGRVQKADGLVVSVVNGAIVVEDVTAKLMPIGQSWKLSWNGQPAETRPVVVQPARQANRSAAVSQ